MPNKNKTTQLGMSYGKASHLLRKQILFSYIQKAGDDNCFRCGNKILTVQELSLDHKEAWLHKDDSLFWDPGNIAFSHLSCNSRARTSAPGIGRLPEGLVWCNICQQYLPECNFWRNKTVWHGFKKSCKSCTRKTDTRKNHSKKS